MLGQRIASRLIAAMAIGSLVSQAGCVALNIPSERYYDAEDSGGVLGHWRGGTVLCDPDSRFCGPNSQIGFHANRHAAAHQCAREHGSGFCFDGGPLEVDPFDDTVDANGNPIKPVEPEVPWPRYHPIPTRPVFDVAVE